ncbi:hypothetical protein [Streptomyces griseofuscus]|uniref:hypothetical protein n=1 Tax=Streptomyces griseofuscus TaxID=146922 RepID=UPI00155AFA17|nr:hypothetical protein [Streptomyces griseofuscus]
MDPERVLAPSETATAMDGGPVVAGWTTVRPSGRGGAVQWWEDLSRPAAPPG